MEKTGGRYGTSVCLFGQNELKAMSAFTTPEPRIVNGVKAAIIKALLCQVNGAQRYGVNRYFYKIELIAKLRFEN